MLRRSTNLRKETREQNQKVRCCSSPCPKSFRGCAINTDANALTGSLTVVVKKRSQHLRPYGPVNVPSIKTLSMLVDGRWVDF